MSDLAASAIFLNEVKKSFGKMTVLNGISGTIEPGKVVGLLGRNGEGKTTLFQVLMDLIEADSGEISVLGHRPNGTGKIRSLVGYVPERPGFHEFLTVGEELNLRARLFRGWSREKAIETASKLEVDLRSSIAGASKGTLAKVAWICATAHSPALLLLDEPTSGLDPVIRQSVLGHLVREMSEEGRAVLVTNHHMEEFLGFLDEVWVLSEGRIQRNISLQQLRNDAVCISGRLKEGAAVPEDLPVIEEQVVGDFVRWLVVDKETIYRIKQADLLENMQTEPMTLETAFRVLLMHTTDMESDSASS